MKQCLIYFMVLIISFPSFAGKYIVVSDTVEHSSHQPVSMSSITSEEADDHCHHSTSGVSSLQVENHNCCEVPDDSPNHSHSSCDDNCVDCSEGCSGFCLALLPDNISAAVNQVQTRTVTAAKIPTAPYHNPLIPPVIQA